MPNAFHLIFGSGPVGCWTAHALRELSVPVKAVNRSVKFPSVDIDICPAPQYVMALVSYPSAFERHFPARFLF